MNSPEFIILCELLDAGTGFVSGSALARKLGMTRVGIWMHMEKLRAQGFEFEAVRSRGYRLSRQPARIAPLLVQAYLRAQRCPELIWLNSVDSTNAEAERQLATGRATPFVVLARRQTVGRGRFGRTWHSEHDGNVYASFAFRPQVEPGRMATFTLWMGANLCDLVANFCRIQPGLKWPNDLYHDGRKFGGMLTEARIDADQIRDLVFGLGLNVNSAAGALPAALAHQATSLSQSTGGSIDLNRLTAAVIGRVQGAFVQFVDGAHRDAFADLWNRYDLLRGKAVVLIQAGRRIEGTAAGIDDEGALLIRGENGRTRRFAAGEVTFERA